MNFVSTINKVSAKIVENAPTIMTGLGLTSMTVGTVEAIKATPKAYDEYMKLKNSENTRTADYIELVGKNYWKALIFYIAGGGSIIFAHKSDLAKLAMATAACNMKDEDLKDYKKSVEKVIGKKKADEVEERYSKDKAMQLDGIETNSCNIIHTGNGNKLCYDIPSRTLFYSSWGSLQAAKNETIDLYQRKGIAEVNDLYDNLGIGYMPIAKDKGWARVYGLPANDTIDIRLGSTPITINGETESVFTIDHDSEPLPEVPMSDRYYDE